MKYVFLGTIDSAWISRQAERLSAAQAKAAELGLTVETVLYVQGPYDFVDTFEAPDAESMLAFSLWYAAQGYGKAITLPAFEAATMDAALARV